MSDLPVGWEWTTLGEVAHIKGGIQKQPKRAPRDNSAPFLRVANVQRGSLDLSNVHRVELFDGELELYRLAHGDLLVVEGNGSIGQLGRSAVWRGEIEGCVHQNHLIRVRTGLGIDANFLGLVWNSEMVSSQLAAVAGSTSGLHTLSVSKLSAIRLPLAPLAEQRVLVDRLDELLAAVDAGEVDVRRALNRAAGLTSTLMREAIPSRWPPSWKRVTVAEAGRVDLGRQRHPDWHHGPNMKPYLRVANVFEDRIDTSDVMEMHFSPAEFERFRLMPDDILLNEGQSPQYLGRPAMYRGCPTEVAFTNSLLRFRAGPGILPEWALLVFRHHMRSGRFMREVRITTNIAHLSAGRFKAVEFPVPPLAEQKRLVDQTTERLSDAARLMESARLAQVRAAALRRSILADAFAGRLVPQDPTDEPASVLLDRIRAERAAEPSRTRRPRAPRPS